MNVYGIPNNMVTGNGPQFVSKLFAVLCEYIDTKLVTTSEYHTQANGKVAGFNKTLVARLQHYIGAHQVD